jgi:predicted  nucleic acid-binding Zn-ribbon protein
MPYRKRLEQLNEEIAALRKRVSTEQRRVFDLQTAGHKAYGYIAHLRDLETSLRLLTSKRDNVTQQQNRRDLFHGSQTLSSPHR